MILRQITHPKTEAAAFRVWQEAKASGGDATIPELARATGLSPGVVRHIVRSRHIPHRPCTPEEYGRRRGDWEIPLDELLKAPGFAV